MMVRDEDQGAAEWGELDGPKKTNAEIEVLADNINEAAAECNKVEGEISLAQATLGRGRATNVYGVYTEDCEVRKNLLDAKDRLDEALKILDSIYWPDSEHYRHF